VFLTKKAWWISYECKQQRGVQRYPVGLATPALSQIERPEWIHSKQQQCIEYSHSSQQQNARVNYVILQCQMIDGHRNKSVGNYNSYNKKQHVQDYQQHDDMKAMAHSQLDQPIKLSCKIGWQKSVKLLCKKWQILLADQKSSDTKNHPT